jgi:chemotaxis signal transduction protein
VYWVDLVGCEVINREGVNFGRIVELMETGANDVLVVRGDRERLIPYIDRVVEAVLPPILPVPGPDHAHIVAHRGQVLPVFDAGLALGGPAVLGQDAVPMLRLGGVAVAVAMVEGLRRVPLSAISAANAASAMRAVCWPAGVAVPVLDPAWLARGA